MYSFWNKNFLYLGGLHMSNLQTLVKGDIAIFENAIKVAGGNKTLAKK